MLASLLARALAFGTVHWRAVGLVMLVAFAGVQSARLGHAKHDLAAARAALVNPKTHKTWQSEANAAASNLETCRASNGELAGAVAKQNDAVAAQKAESDRRLAAATKAARDAQAVAESARQQSGTLMARRLLGTTDCERSDDVRRAFLEVVK